MNVVITGASRGLGKAMAEIFAANGHHLFITSRNEVALYKTMEELLAQYPDVRIKAKARDLSVKEETIGLGKWIIENGYPVDVLINNAGSFVPGSVHNEPDGALEEMIQTNLYSAYHLTRTLLPVMMQSKSGHIFNICSIASLSAYKNGGAYSISKYAMNGFSKNLRKELMEFNIKVTSVFPGAAYTDSWKESGVPAERFMEPEDVAKMVFAASQLSFRACVEDIVLRPQSGDL